MYQTSFFILIYCNPVCTLFIHKIFFKDSSTAISAAEICPCKVQYRLKVEDIKATAQAYRLQLTRGINVTGRKSHEAVYERYHGPLININRAACNALGPLVLGSRCIASVIRFTRRYPRRGFLTTPRVTPKFSPNQDKLEMTSYGHSCKVAY